MGVCVCVWGGFFLFYLSVIDIVILRMCLLGIAEKE